MVKKFWVGAAYAVIVVLALVAWAVLGTWVEISILLPLIGQDWAETVMFVPMIIGGGLVGYFGRIYWHPFKKKAGV